MIASEINSALDTYFPSDFFIQLNGTDGNKLNIIAEPGRYYACSAFTLCVSVIAKRAINQSDSEQKADREKYSVESKNMATATSIAALACSSNSLTPSYVNTALDTSKWMNYHVNDSFFASFKILIIDHFEFHPVLVNDHSDVRALYKSSIWGSSTDGRDLIIKECILPELNTEEYIMFRIMGAYTIACSSAYDGMTLPGCIYVVSNTKWETVKNAFKDLEIADLSLMKT